MSFFCTNEHKDVDVCVHGVQLSKKRRDQHNFYSRSLESKAGCKGRPFAKAGDKIFATIVCYFYLYTGIFFDIILLRLINNVCSFDVI